MDNKKISIIIPTMQKNILLLNKLLEKLNYDKCVDEILIIDNSTKGFESNFSKVFVVRIFHFKIISSHQVRKIYSIIIIYTSF